MKMTVVEHLEELRRRLLVCVAAVAVGTAGAFVARDRMLALLLRPLPMQAGALATVAGEHRLAVTGVGEAFSVVLKLSLAVGIALATPVGMYQLWAFAVPALRVRERRWALPFALLGVVLFATGLAVGFATLRYPIAWLLGFGDGWFVEIVTADNYFTFVAYFLLAFGLTFELPLVLSGLVVVGVVSPDALRRRRAAVLMGLWTVSCFITPGADPYSPVIVGVALTVLFFVSMGLIRVVTQSRSPVPVMGRSSAWPAHVPPRTPGRGDVGSPERPPEASDGAVPPRRSPTAPPRRSGCSAVASRA